MSPKDDAESSSSLRGGRRRTDRHRSRRTGVAAAVAASLAGVAMLTLLGDPPPTGLAVPGASTSTGTAGSSGPSPAPDATAGSSSPSRGASLVAPVLDRTTGSRLLVVQGTRLELLDVDTGRTESWATDPRLAGYERIEVLPVAGELVLLGVTSSRAGHVPLDVLSTTAGAGSALQVVGEASRVLPSATPGRLWLSLASDPENADGATVTFSEVAPDGTVHRRIVLPRTFHAEPFAGGFLRYDRTGSGLELVDARGRVQRSYPGKRTLHAGPDAAVLVDGPACGVPCDALVLRATSPVTQHPLEVPQAVGEAVAGGGVTVDGTALWTAWGWQRPGDVGSLTRTDLRTGESTPVQGVTAQTSWDFDPQFTPDGRWMFWPDADGVHVNAYDLPGDAAYRVPGRFREITSVVVLPPR